MGSSHIQHNVRQERMSDLASGPSPFERNEELDQTFAANAVRVPSRENRRTPPPLPADARK